MGAEGETEGGTESKRMRLRYRGACRSCGGGLAAGTYAVYDRSNRSVRCIECPPAAAIASDPAGIAKVQDNEHVHGSAGASARREFERLKSAREERVRGKYPRLGGLLLALSDDPQTTRAWDSGAEGERRLGRHLDSVSGPLLRVLHDRRVPGSRANIDHIAIAPSGVFVIDAKKYQGRPQLRFEGGILRPRTERLFVGGRDRSRLVDGVLAQCCVVRAAMRDSSGVQIRATLCFVGADWPLIGGDFQTRGVHVLWPKKLTSVLTKPGPLTESDIATIHQQLTRVLPSA